MPFHKTSRLHCLRGRRRRRDAPSGPDAAVVRPSTPPRRPILGWRDDCGSLPASRSYYYLRTERASDEESRETSRWCRFSCGRHAWHSTPGRPVSFPPLPGSTDDDDDDTAAPMDLLEWCVANRPSFRRRSRSVPVRKVVPPPVLPSFLPSFFVTTSESSSGIKRLTDGRSVRSAWRCRRCRAFCPERIFSMMSIMMMKIIVIMSRAAFDGRRGERRHRPPAPATAVRADSTRRLTDFRPSPDLLT